MGLGAAVHKDGAPVPEPDVIEVQERLGEPTTYRLRYTLSIGEGDFPLLTSGNLDAGARLSVVAEAGKDKTETLVKGPVHGQQIHFDHGGAASWVEVLGSDRSIELDREVRAAIWPDGKPSDAIRTIIGRYAPLQADVEDSPSRFEEQKHALVQRDSDLGFVRRLARRHGALFWITTNPQGIETAHFRRPPMSGTPARELSINVDKANMPFLDIRWDVERPTSAVAAQIDLNDKSVLSGQVASNPLRTLGTMPLSAIASGTRSVQVIAPVDDTGELRARAEGALIEAGWFVRATGRTSTRGLGGLLHAHTLVGLQGVGKRHSGTWLVGAVRHVIDVTGHVMDFELLRNGWAA